MDDVEIITMLHERMLRTKQTARARAKIRQDTETSLNSKSPTTFEQMVKEQKCELENYFKPKIDQQKSIKAMKICFVKSPGPRETLKGKIVSRSMVGTEDILNQAQLIKEMREKKQKEELLGIPDSTSMGRLTTINLRKEFPDDNRSIMSKRSVAQTSNTKKSTFMNMNHNS